ncbi:MAG: hypothetical protein ACP5I8_11440 [Phycisphaerae bacterium]
MLVVYSRNSTRKSWIRFYEVLGQHDLSGNMINFSLKWLLVTLIRLELQAMGT